MSKSTSYYFDYKVELIKDELDTEIKQEDYPFFFVERNYGAANIPYQLYLVIPSWFEPLVRRERYEKDPKCKYLLNENDLPFNNVEILLDSQGIDVDYVGESKDDRKEAEIYINTPFSKDVSISFGGGSTDESYRANEYKIPILDSSKIDFSSVGKIIFTSNKSGKIGKKLIFYFAINFYIKKRIQYNLNHVKDGVKVELFGNKVPGVISFSLLSANRLPCLEEDVNKCKKVNFSVEFKNNKGEIIIPNSELDLNLSKKAQKNYLYLVFDNSKFNNISHIPDFKLNLNFNSFYFLDCLENFTLDKSRIPEIPSNEIIMCPYCHNKININGDKSILSKYKKSCVTCAGNDSPLPLLGRTGKTLKEIILCQSDVELNDVNRMLPAKMLSHTFNRILVIGTNQSGKSTLISRMFNVKRVIENQDAKSISNPVIDGISVINPIKTLLPKLKVNYYASPKIEVSSKGDTLVQTLNRWYDVNNTINDRKFETTGSKFYFPYSIQTGENKHFVLPTVISDEQIINRPFMLEINKKHYIGLYDIAGENCKKDNRNFIQLTTACNYGVLLVINGAILCGRSDNIGKDDTSTDDHRSSTSKVITILTEDAKQKFAEGQLKPGETIPVAVMVTKSDHIQGLMNSTATCLRDDYFDFPNKRYEGSYLESFIDMSSHEIKSLLNNYKFELPLESEEYAGKPIFNVKYFWSSSFPQKRNVKENMDPELNDEVSFLNYNCSPSRVELPLIWLMKQRGVII